MTASPPATQIVFGTDGWRARVAEDFTFENVRRCADGVARYVLGNLFCIEMTTPNIK